MKDIIDTANIDAITFLEEWDKTQKNRNDPRGGRLKAAEWLKRDRVPIKGKGIVLAGNLYCLQSETEAVRSRAAWARLGKTVVAGAKQAIIRKDPENNAKMWPLYRESDTRVEQ